MCYFATSWIIPKCLIKEKNLKRNFQSTVIFTECIICYGICQSIKIMDLHMDFSTGSDKVVWMTTSYLCGRSPLLHNIFVIQTHGAIQLGIRVTLTPYQTAWGTKLHLMVRLQFRRSWRCVVPFYRYYFKVHCHRSQSTLAQSGSTW